jgi:hypothetical protein
MKIFKKVTGRLFLVNLDLVGFLHVTTCERENGFLLIETFWKTNLWPPGFDPWWLLLYVRVSKNYAFLRI